MKYFIIIAVLVGVVFTNPLLEEIQPRSSLIDCITATPGILARKSHHYHEPGSGISEVVISYIVPANPPANDIYITCIKAIDQKQNHEDFEADVQIIQGGLYEKMVTLKITSHEDKGFDYEVEIRIDKSPVTTVLVGVALANPLLEEIQPKSSLIVCDSQKPGVIGQTTHHYNDPVSGEILEETVTYIVPSGPKPAVISCIRAIDKAQNHEDFEGDVTIVEGGLYQKMVALQITSHEDKGYDYEIEIRLSESPV